MLRFRSAWDLACTALSMADLLSLRPWLHHGLSAISRAQSLQKVLEFLLGLFSGFMSLEDAQQDLLNPIDPILYNMGIYWGYIRIMGKRMGTTTLLEGL